MSVRILVITGLLALSSQMLFAEGDENALKTGPWRAWLDSPGGELPFGLELEHKQILWKAWMVNGPQRIEVPRVTWDGKTLTLDIDYYDSKITAKLRKDGNRLDGQWKKRAKKGWTEMAFHATPGDAPRFTKRPGTKVPMGRHKIDGKWLAKFSENENPIIAVFRRESGDTVTGTFMTPTGDYGHLAGQMDGPRLRLSGFDGAHAFLFHATVQPRGLLRGDFWSRDTWHETWSAERDVAATLPDAFAQTKWTGKAKLADLRFPDLTGTPRSLADPEFTGKARIIEIFGTWCPNCHDASNYLMELHRRYAKRGLKIVALAFELTEDPKRNRKLVKTYVKRHGIEYPVLVAGMADKEKVAKVLPVIDKLRSYPTSIFLNAKGEVQAIHTGFTGPATGEEYKAMCAKFESLIEGMLPKKPAKPKTP